MSQQVEIQAIPSQELTVNLEGFSFQLNFKSSKTSTFVTIIRDNETIISNVRAVAGAPLIPFEYLEGDAGNFLITTTDDAIPYYTQFGISQFLLYFSASELEAIREPA